jgi:hypothetical protein
MEANNRVPNDPYRRWVLATLLCIPPALLLGESFTQEVLPKQSSLHLRHEESIDLEEYSTSLLSYAVQDYNGVADVSGALKDMHRRIHKLHSESPYSSQKEKMMLLLCGYHIRAGSIAIILAEEHHYDALYVAALDKRGALLMDQGNVVEALKSFEAAKYAIDHPNKTEEGHSYISPPSQGGIYIALAKAKAHMAERPADLDAALKLVDEAEGLIGQKNSEPDLTAVYSIMRSAAELERVYLERSAILLEPALQDLHRPMTAQGQIDLAIENASPYSSSRKHQAYINILQARSWYDRGYHKIATTLATEALVVMKEINSRANINRIAQLHSDLKESSYGKSTDVAWLGLELAKAGAAIS